MINIASTENASWRLAKKTAWLKAKPVANAIDPLILNKVKIDTLEGLAEVGQNNVICIGITGEIWQQSITNLVDKYDIRSITCDGWFECSPKPENEVECFQITDDSGYIIGIWGETIEGVKNLQSFEHGDYICRQTYFHDDQWVVRQHIFRNSYKFL